MPVKSVPIQLDRRRHLRFDYNAFAELQRECRISFADIERLISAAELSGQAGFLLPLFELRGFIWAGLLDESPGITLKEVGDILDDCLTERPGDIGKALFEAIMESSFAKAATKKASGPEMKTPKAKRKPGRKRISSKRVTDLP